MIVNSGASDNVGIFFFQAEDGIRDWSVTGVQTCALPISVHAASTAASTTGRYSGRHPAITALIAIFSTVAGTRSGGTIATISSGARRVPSSRSEGVV